MDGPWTDFQPQAPTRGPWNDFAQPVAPATPQGFMANAADVAKGAGRGLVNAVGDIPSAIPSALSAVGDLTDAALRKFNLMTPEMEQQNQQRNSLRENVQATLPASFDERFTGKGQSTPSLADTLGIPRPQGEIGKGAETISRFIPAAFGLRGSIRSGLTSGIGAGIGALIGEKVAPDNPYVSGGLAVLGGATPTMSGRLLNPFQPSAERQAAATILRGEGVNPTAGQVTGNPVLKAVENPFGTFNENQQRSFTQAAMERTGQRTLARTEDVDSAFTRIGGEFNRIGRSHDVTSDPALYRDVGNSLRSYQTNVAPTLQVPRVVGLAGDIAAQAQTGRIPGPQYLAWRSDIGELARSATDDHLRDAYYGLQRALDNAMERSMQGSPDIGAFREARRQYRNLQPIVNAITSGGEQAAQGLLTPGKLGQAVTRLEGKAGKARGRGDFTDLVNAANAIMTPLPNSGTPVRAAAAALGGVLGLGAGPAGVGLGSAAGAIGGPIAAAAAVRNPISRFYLSGRLAPNAGLNRLTRTQRAALSAYYAAQGGGLLGSSKQNNLPQ